VLSMWFGRSPGHSSAPPETAHLACIPAAAEAAALAAALAAAVSAATATITAHAAAAGVSFKATASAGRIGKGVVLFRSHHFGFSISSS